MGSEAHPRALHALAAGHFTDLGKRFALGGRHVQMPGPGMLRVSHPAPRLRLLLSVGVHGNETAPIEMLAPVLARLADTPDLLAVDLLVVVGNAAAIAIGARFIDADLNRLFTHARGALQDAAEAARADAVMQASADFFAVADVPKWHLDLHSAIRPSRFPRFAIVPAAAGDAAQGPLTSWLGTAGIEAVVFNTQQAATYSAYTAHALGAFSCTVELGQIGVLGQHSPDQFVLTQRAISALLRGQDLPAGEVPVRFRVEQEIIKHTDAFRMCVDNGTHNFTAFAPGSIIATDEKHLYRTGAATEYILFPNPDVRIGQRAGLMVAQDR